MTLVPKRNFQSFHVKIFVKLPLLNPNDNKRKVIIRNNLLTDQNLRLTILEAVDFFKFTVGESKKKFDKFVNPVFEFFTMKRDIISLFRGKQTQYY